MTISKKIKWTKISFKLFHMHLFLILLIIAEVKNTNLKTVLENPYLIDVDNNVSRNKSNVIKNENFNEDINENSVKVNENNIFPKAALTPIYLKRIESEKNNNSRETQSKYNNLNKKNGKKQNFDNKNIFLYTQEYQYEDLFTPPYSDNSSSDNQNSNSNDTENSKPKKCRVLVLQGGGDKGAYQAGAIKALSENLPEESRNWDVITGISVGAVNAAVMSIFEKGNEIAAADFLLEKWKNLKDYNDIYKSWLLGPIEGYFYKSGFYDTTPMREFLDEIISDKHKQIKRKVVIGATDVKNGAYIRFNEDYLSQSPENFRDSIMASAAYPVIFPNVLIGNQTFMDGGVKAVVDIPAGINKCFDMGFTAEQVYLDMILCNAISISDYDKESYNPIQILLRILELYSYEKTVRDIQDSMAFYKNVNWRYLIKPQKGLPWNENPLNFSPEQIEEMITAGLQNGKEVVEKNEGFYFKEFLDYFMIEKKDFFQVKLPNWNFLRANPKNETNKYII